MQGRVGRADCIYNCLSQASLVEPYVRWVEEELWDHEALVIQEQHLHNAACSLSFWVVVPLGRKSESDLKKQDQEQAKSPKSHKIIFSRLDIHKS